MTDAYLVDSCVFVRWFIDQAGHEHAREVHKDFLDGRVRLETLDFARFEVAHVLRKVGYLKKLFDMDAYVIAVGAIDDLSITAHPTDRDRLARAAALAPKSMGLYDAVFVQAAIDLGLPLLTADARLCKAANGLVRTELLRGADSSLERRVLFGSSLKRRSIPDVRP